MADLVADARATIARPGVRTAAKHALLVVALLGGTQLLAFYFTYRAERIAHGWTRYVRFGRTELDSLTGTDTIPIVTTQAVVDSVLSPGRTFPAARQDTTKGASREVAMTPDERTRLMRQLTEIRRRAKHHLSVMEFFYTRYYMAITLFSVIGAIAALLLSFIVAKGWKDSSTYLITAFVVMTGTAAFYKALPSEFRQEQNIADNKTLYLQYVSLENELMSYLATGEDLNEKPAPPAHAIHYLDGRLKELNNLAIGFDYTKVPDYSATFQRR
jgi:hypothetical protein